MRLRGGVSLVVLYLTWAALHDITLDNAQTFPLEYSFLVLSGVWFVSVALRLLGQGHRLEAVVSLLAVAVGLAACWNLPHHGAPASWMNQLAWFSVLWFFVLTLRLLLFPPRAGAPSRPIQAGEAGH